MFATPNQALFKEKGLASETVSRRRISLPNENIANEVLVEIRPGGKSRRIFVIVEGRGYAIDCETYAENWGNVEPIFERIITSLRLGK